MTNDELENLKITLKEMIESNEYLVGHRHSDSQVTSHLSRVQSRGSSGGSCWDTYTQEFRVSDSEKKNELYQDIKYRFKVFSILSNTSDLIQLSDKAYREAADEHYYDEIDTQTDGSDYYGNYTEYSIIAIPIAEIMEKVLSPTDFGIFKEVFETIATKRKVELENMVKQERFNQLSQLIENFDETTNKEKAALAKTIKQEQEHVANLIKKAEKFDNTKAKERKVLLKEKEKLESEGFQKSTLKKRY